MEWCTTFYVASYRGRCAYQPAPHQYCQIWLGGLETSVYIEWQPVVIFCNNVRTHNFAGLYFHKFAGMHKNITWKFPYYRSTLGGNKGLQMFNCKNPQTRAIHEIRRWPIKTALALSLHWESCYSTWCFGYCTWPCLKLELPACKYELIVNVHWPIVWGQVRSSEAAVGARRVQAKHPRHAVEHSSL